MDLVASFSSQKVNTFNFFSIRGILGANSIVFLFDTGAVCPVVGVNSFFREGQGASEKRMQFEKFLQEEIDSGGIISRPLKAANNQPILTYPCVCHHATIENTNERVFYFDVSFDDVSIPLLGESFIDDCAYNHAINGNINITGIKNQAGYGYYADTNVIDFDKVAKRFEAMK